MSAATTNQTAPDPNRVIAVDGPKSIEERALATLEGLRQQYTQEADGLTRKGEAARLRGKDDQAKFCKEQETLFRLIARRIAIGMGAKLATEQQAAPAAPAPAGPNGQAAPRAAQGR